MAIKYGATGLHDSSDDTKIVAFDASGITTGNTRTVTVPDGDVTLGTPDDNSVTLAKMAHGTDGEIITYDASGAPATVAVGTSGQVLTSNGAGNAPTFQGGGKVLQVVSDTFTGTNSTNTKVSSGSFANTSLSATITPSANTSTIVIIATVNTGSTNGTDGSCILRLVRDSTAISVGAASGSRILASTGRGTASQDTHTLLSQSITCEDSPSTTSATTYTVQFGVRGATGSGTVYINRTATDGNSSEYQRTASSLILMEIGA